MSVRKKYSPVFKVKMLGQNKSAFADLVQNKLFILIAIIIAIEQILITQFGGEVFRITPLSFIEWVWIDLVQKN